MLSDNARGALWMSASMAGFVLNDALMKSLSDEVPLFQAIFLRGIVATVLIGVLAWWQGVLLFLPTGRDRLLIAVRLLSEIAMVTLFLTALFNMKLANAIAILQATPLVVTLAASLFLRERVGWRRYAAIVIGFCGVLLIVRPGTDAFNIYALSAIAAVFCLVLRDLTTRQLSGEVPSLSVTVATAAVITVFAGIMVPLTSWEPVGWLVIGKLACAAVFLLVGYYAGVHAMRIGEIGIVQPFRYTNLVWALLLGWVVFGNLPDVIALFGAGLVVATGIFAFYRERRLGR